MKGSDAMKRDNPFTLTFGKQPSQYIDRYECTNEILSAFESDYDISNVYLISGIRRSGKTVLMTAIANELKQTEHWTVVSLNITQDLLTDLSMRLADACERIPHFFRSGFEISIAGCGIGINGTDESRDSVSRIIPILEHFKQKKRKLLITIDEVVPNDNMRRFATQFQIFIRDEYPVYLLMTGLYDNIYAIQNDPLLTFLLRSPKIFLGPLAIGQITAEYKKIFQIGTEEAKCLAHITKGYAFAFQALGMLYWEYGKDWELEAILEKLDGMLDDFVYKKIWEGLSEQDRRVVLAIPEESSGIKVGDLCRKLSMTSSVFSKYRERLLNKGIILSPQYGYVSLALPRFSTVIHSYL